MSVSWTSLCLTVVDFGIGDGNNLDPHDALQHWNSQMYRVDESVYKAKQARFKVVQLSSQRLKNNAKHYRAVRQKNEEEDVLI